MLRLRILRSKIERFMIATLQMTLLWIARWRKSLVMMATARPRLISCAGKSVCYSRLSVRTV